MKSKFPIYLVAAFAAALARAPLTLAAPVELHTYRTHSRLAFPIDGDVDPVWKEVPGGFELFLKGIGLADLGVPLGGESGLNSELKSVKDQRLASIEMKELPEGLKIIGKWKFPTGDNAPAKPEMAHFDYHQPNPPEYLVDFWPKAGPTVREARAAKHRAAELELERQARVAAKKRAERRLASLQARREAEDTYRFCREPLSEKNDVFLPFEPVHEKIDFSHWFARTTPDEHFNYFRPTTDTRDAQYVRLALDLYEQGKPALVIRTLDFFNKEEPRSPFRNEMRFLRANALYRLGMKRECMDILKDLMLVATDSPVALHAGMYVASKSMEENNPLQALESFLWLIQHHPENDLLWVFHLGAAEAMYALRQTGRAAKEYQWIAEKGPDARSQAEAAMRVGDLYLERKQYDQSLAAYFEALHYYKEQSDKFPTVFLNRAESLYWLGDYKRAGDAFRSFVAKFPSNPSGWRATFRLAEIAARAQGAASPEARKWYTDTINRYPMSPGATLARARLIPCDDHGGFDLAASERFFSTEAKDFNSHGEVSVDKFPDFRMLAHIRSLITLGTEEKAVDAAMAELKANPGSVARDMVGTTLAALFRKSILAMLVQGKKFEAVSFYHDRKDLLPPDATPGTEADYLLKLSQAASDLGLSQFAQELIQSYDKASALPSPGRQLASTPAPDKNDLDEKLRVAEESFTRAKALWLTKGTSESSKVRDLLGKVIEESPFSYEREIILGLTDMSDKKPASALAHVLKAQLLLAQPAGAQPDAAVREDAARLAYWAASLHATAGSGETAIQMYRDLENQVREAGKTENAQAGGTAAGAAVVLGVPPVPPLADLYLAEGKLHEKLGQWGDAAAAYARAVDRKLGGNQLLFEYARALNQTGDVAKAGDVLKTVADSKQEDFWKKLAQEALADRSIASGPFRLGGANK